MTDDAPAIDTTAADPMAAFDAPASEPVSQVNDFLAAFEDISSEPAALEGDIPPTDVPTEPAADAPAAEEPKDDIDAIEPPARASQAAKDNFNKIKESAKSYRTRAEAAEKEAERLRNEDLKVRDTELEELRAKLAKLPEFEEKAKFAEEAERELAISRVEGTREYKDTIEKPLIAIEQRASSIAAANDLKIDDILDALTERDPAKQSELLDDLVAGLKPTDQARVIRMAEDTQQLLAKRDTIRERAAEAKKELEEITRQNETKAQREKREAFESATSHAVTELKKRIPFVSLAEGETVDNVFDTLLEKAKSTDFDAASTSTKAFAATAAILLPRVTKQNVKLQAEIETLKARIAESNSSRATVKGDPAPVQTEGKGFLENIHEALGVPFQTVNLV